MILLRLWYRADWSFPQIPRPVLRELNGFLTLAGGVIITFAKEILTLITG